MKVAQAQLGHSHMATTLEIYTHASGSAQRDAVNLLEEQLFPNVPKLESCGSIAEKKSASSVSYWSGRPDLNGGLLRPRQARYQAALRPDMMYIFIIGQRALFLFLAPCAVRLELSSAAFVRISCNRPAGFNFLTGHLVCSFLHLSMGNIRVSDISLELRSARNTLPKRSSASILNWHEADSGSGRRVLSSQGSPGLRTAAEASGVPDGRCAPPKIQGESYMLDEEI